MRACLCALVVLGACQTTQPAAPVAAPAPAPAAAQAPAPVPPALPTPAQTRVERLAADTPRTTVTGNRFVAPGGWGISVRGAATILEPPEPAAHIALVDVQAKTADE